MTVRWLTARHGSVGRWKWARVLRLVGSFGQTAVSRNGVGGGCERRRRM